MHNLKIYLMQIGCLLLFQHCSFSQPGPTADKTAVHAPTPAQNPGKAAEQAGPPGAKQDSSTKKSNASKEMEPKNQNPFYSRSSTEKLNLSEEEWKKILPQDLFYIARMKGTERPWTSKFEDFKELGTYYCAACGNALFKSDTKFDSGCGWPSFYQPISKGSIIYAPDNSHGMKRTEVMCGRCKAHLGHVFEDGPPPTGLRYCINGVILDFEKKLDK